MSTDGGNSTSSSNRGKYPVKHMRNENSFCFRHFEWSLEFYFSSVNHSRATEKRDERNREWRMVRDLNSIPKRDCNKHSKLQRIWYEQWCVCVSKLVRDRNEHTAGRERERALSLSCFSLEKSSRLPPRSQSDFFHVDDKAYAFPLQRTIENTWIGHSSLVRCYVNRRTGSVCRTYTCTKPPHTHTPKPKWKRMHQTVKYYKHSIKALSFSQME